MSAVPPLESKSRIVPSTARIHRMRVARGACWVIVGALAVGAALTLLDAFVRLPEWCRGLALAVWITSVGVMVWRLVARRVPPDPDTTTAHARTELPGNLRAAAAAVLAIAAALLAATLVPGALEHVRRVALPWTRSTGPLLYRVKVTSGEPVVRRGDAVTLSAYAEKLDPSAATPEEATLVCRDRNGAESRYTMSGDGRGAFHATRSPLLLGFEYRVEIGAATSDWFEVAALDPVEPTDESAIEVIPPQYAPTTSRRIFQGFKPFDGTQYSTAKPHFRFNRPAATAFLEWRADGTTVDELIPIVLAHDMLRGSASFRLKQDGVITLVTVAEVRNRALRSMFTVRVRVDPDMPPRFERIAGVSPYQRSARPGTRVPIEFTAIDDIALGSATLEYVAGGVKSAPVQIPIELAGQGAPRAQGRVELDLTGLARVGESVRFRIRIADARRLDEPVLKPQEAVFPEAGWSQVIIQEVAPPLEEQDVRLDEQAMNNSLVSALAAVRQARADAERVRMETAGSAGLTLDQAALLTNASDRLVWEAIEPLRESTRLAALTPDLHPLAAAVRQLLSESLASAEDSVRRSAIDNPTERAASLAAAGRQLDNTARQIGYLIESNARLRQARLDRAAIAALGREEAALARTSGAPDELARLQRELFARLRKLIAESDALRSAVDRARHLEYLRLAEATESLSAAVRDLGAAAQQLDSDTRHAIFAELAREQGRLVAAAGALETKASTAARLAGVELPKAAQFVRIAELIEMGMTVEALTAIEERGQQLDTIAAAVESWTNKRRDPKVEAHLFGAWQDDIRLRFQNATAGDPASFAMLAAATKSAFLREQLAVRDALVEMQLPPDESIRNLKIELLDHLAKAAIHLQAGGTSADVVMKIAGERFTRLADRIPTSPDRLIRARADLLRIQQAQDALLAAVDQAIRAPDAAKRLTPLVEQQEKQLRALAALDAPGAALRMERLTGAMTAAASDLRDGAAADALASQQWLNRELERLEQFLDDVPPIDDRTPALARKLEATLKAFEKLGPAITARQVEALAAEARELARQAGLLGIPAEAAALGNAARLAAQSLEAAARDTAVKPDEFRKSLRNAAEALTRLADRLNGAESDLDRVRRLAWNRHVAVREARLKQGKPLNPDASAEAVRQLTREPDELTFTRVGLAGQPLRKKALDQYSRLKEQPYPEQKAALHAALAETLDELAAVMADCPDLTRTFGQSDPTSVPTGADEFVPTPRLAESIRELARNQRAFRDRLTGVEEELRARTTPAKSNPIAEIEKRQREFAASITRFARSLEGEAEDSTAKLALRAAIDATLAADGLANGMVRPAGGSANEAARSLRMLAASGKLPWAAIAAELAAKQDAIRTSLRPPLDAPGAVAAQLKARGEELTRRAAELAGKYSLAARGVDAGDPVGLALMAAAAELKLAESLLAESTRSLALSSFAESARSRGEAVDRLRAAVEKTASLTKNPPGTAEPDPAALGAAEQLRRAELAMRMALDALEPKPDRSRAETAIREAAEALQQAAKIRTDLKLRLRP